MENVLGRIIEDFNEKSKTEDFKLMNNDLENYLNELKEVGFEYSEETYPELENTGSFDSEIPNSPKNLAEGLIWKIGKWKSYINFIKYYKNDLSEPKSTDVVFYAFARHLKNNDNPIFDQHTARAMIFLNPELTEEEINNLKNFLIDNKGKWKTTGSGPAKECYDIYKKFIKRFQKKNISIKKLDKFLMMFGSAIKKNSTDLYDE